MFRNFKNKKQNDLNRRIANLEYYDTENGEADEETKSDEYEDKIKTPFDYSKDTILEETKKIIDLYLYKNYGLDDGYIILLSGFHPLPNSFKGYYALQGEFDKQMNGYPLPGNGLKKRFNELNRKENNINEPKFISVDRYMVKETDYNTLKTALQIASRLGESFRRANYNLTATCWEIKSGQPNLKDIY